MALNRMELLQRTLVMMDSTLMEMPLGYASMNIGRVLNLCAQQVSPACVYIICIIMCVHMHIKSLRIIDYTVYHSTV